jgi:hypothetical protein
MPVRWKKNQEFSNCDKLSWHLLTGTEGNNENHSESNFQLHSVIAEVNNLGQQLLEEKML